MVNIMVGGVSTLQRCIYLKMIFVQALNLNDKLLKENEGKEFGLQLDEAIGSSKD